MVGRTRFRGPLTQPDRTKVRKSSKTRYQLCWSNPNIVNENLIKEVVRTSWLLTRLNRSKEGNPVKLGNINYAGSIQIESRRTSQKWSLEPVGF